jgi:hypothetical protein
MTTNTDLANHALSMLGEMPIASIDEVGSKPARLCKQFAETAVAEVLSLGRWNRSTLRATLAQASPAPSSGLSFYYQLPADCLRVLEINGEQWGTSDEYFELEGMMLASDSSTCTIRYIAKVPIGMLGALLQQAITCRLAAKLAVPLQGSAEKAQQMEGSFRRALGEARQVDAQECGSRENPAWSRIMGRSRLIMSRFGSANRGRFGDAATQSPFKDNATEPGEPFTTESEPAIMTESEIIMTLES